MDWISNLQSLGLKQQKYSLYKELEVMIKYQKSNENDQIDETNQIKLLNDSFSTKIDNKLDSFKQYQEYQKCQQILQELSSQFYQQSIYVQIQLLNLEILNFKEVELKCIKLLNLG
ncbi:unnamed protein product (macronuclear) [Paramecium tetraurelia]|uniref:Uncharacterized protein n=1 Tax=Paramecium tetraurelia TaxID=5888 RepID=A0BEV5_PARTE|nr:uncharacterized protein GSPATT00028106001 [Paramecium tetraurelia]CAK57072.1 unnamed protein product [Paramecium tetraurelia]|eukprot:XP_001424470.1 hypothetical protein (macronuclear) [Paramecium tetraurelia strain d4-2]